jgi:hypothetical protein
VAKVIYKGTAGPGHPIYTGELMVGARLTIPAKVSPPDQKAEVRNDTSNSEIGSEDSKPEKDR